MKNFVAFLSAFMFALGLAVSGMTQPQRVIAFLSINNWDPSLLFVMVGAISVHSVAYFFIRHQKRPVLESQWHIGHRRDITPRLLVGSALFGTGWGLGGYCPGPALTSLVTGQHSVILFVIAMIFGMLVFRWSEARLSWRQ